MKCAILKGIILCLGRDLKKINNRQQKTQQKQKNIFFERNKNTKTLNKKQFFYFAFQSNHIYINLPWSAHSALTSVKMIGYYYLSLWRNV